MGSSSSNKFPAQIQTLLLAMVAMKAMKAKKVSVIAKGSRARASVFFGSKVKTYTGLKKSDLMKSKTGKIVTRKSHAAGLKAYKQIKGWTAAVQKARKELGCNGFVQCGRALRCTRRP